MTADGKKKMLKAFRLGAKISWWCVIVLLAALLFSIFRAKISGKVPSVFGYSVINIISSSMEDKIPKDSYILIRTADPEEVKCNDIICFYSTDPRIYGLPNTHRVVEEPIVTENGLEFVTRGDANPTNDPVNAEGENLIGIYVEKLDGLTAFSNALKGNTLIIMIIVLQLGIAAMFVCTVMSAKAKAKENKDGGEK